MDVKKRLALNRTLVQREVSVPLKGFFFFLLQLTYTLLITVFKFNLND